MNTVADALREWLLHDPCVFDVCTVSDIAALESRLLEAAFSANHALHYAIPALDPENIRHVQQAGGQVVHTISELFRHAPWNTLAALAWPNAAIDLKNYDAIFAEQQDGATLQHAMDQLVGQMGRLLIAVRFVRHVYRVRMGQSHA